LKERNIFEQINKKIWAINSAERGVLSAVVFGASVGGNSLSPIMTFH
jgi:hypothetical protein